MLFRIVMLMVLGLATLAAGTGFEHKMDYSSTVKARHKQILDDENLLVTVTVKQDVHNCDGVRIAQAAINLLYQFDLGKSAGLTTLPGLPLKVYPTRQMKMSTFAAFIPESSEGYFGASTKDNNDDDDEQRKESALWRGTQDTISGSAVLLIESLADGNRLVRIQTTVNAVDDLEEVRLILPPSTEQMNEISAESRMKHNFIISRLLPLLITSSAAAAAASSSSSHSAPSGVENDDQIRAVLFHLYRGDSCDLEKCYTRFTELVEYVHTAVIGFLSPFVLLGISFVIIAVGVFCWLNVFNSGEVVEATDEKRSPDGRIYLLT